MECMEAKAVELSHSLNYKSLITAIDNMNQLLVGSV